MKNDQQICMKCGKRFPPTIYPSGRKEDNCSYQERKFCSRKCYLIWQKGENSSWFGKNHTEETKEKISSSRTGKYGGEASGRWKGGVTIGSDGYVYIHSPNHPNKDSRNCVRKHRLVMEEHLGRYLTSEEVVHHEDEDKKNNNINNLKLFKNSAEHMRYHKGRKLEEERN